MKCKLLAISMAAVLSAAAQVDAQVVGAVLTVTGAEMH